MTEWSCPRWTVRSASMRLLVARCEVLYTGRLTARLPEAVRLLMFKADGSFLVHDDAGGFRPLNCIRNKFRPRLANARADRALRAGQESGGVAQTVQPNPRASLVVRRPCMPSRRMISTCRFPSRVATAPRKSTSKRAAS